MNALGGRGIYPINRRLPRGTCLLDGAGAGCREGGNSFELGDDGSESSGDGSSGLIYVPRVTLGAKVTTRGPGE
jgi:hypothetical protein